MNDYQNVITKKNPYGFTSGLNETQPLTNVIIGKEDEKSHYYGEIKKISSINDISFLNRGSVYFLRDNIKDPNSTFHPYLVIQASYLDKISKITVLGITSTPSAINMVPIIMKNSIGYIDPHHPYTYKIDEWSEPTTRYAGSIVNSQAMEIACNLYGLYLGLNMAKTEEEIIDEYIKYVEEFKERSKDLKPYKHKVLEENNLDGLELKVSYISECDDIIQKEDDNNESNYIINDDTEIHEMIDITNDNNEKESLIIDITNQAVLSMIGIMEDNTDNAITLPRHVKDITSDEAIIFLTYEYMYGSHKTAKFYNCSQSNISYKKKCILEKFNVTYTGKTKKKDKKKAKTKKIRKPRIDKELLNEAVEMYRGGGYSINEISILTGISYSSISRAIRA